MRRGGIKGAGVKRLEGFSFFGLYYNAGKNCRCGKRESDNYVGLFGSRTKVGCGRL